MVLSFSSFRKPERILMLVLYCFKYISYKLLNENISLKLGLKHSLFISTWIDRLESVAADHTELTDSPCGVVT